MIKHLNLTNQDGQKTLDLGYLEIEVEGMQNFVSMATMNGANEKTIIQERIKEGTILYYKFLIKDLTIKIYTIQNPKSMMMELLNLFSEQPEKAKEALRRMSSF